MARRKKTDGDESENPDNLNESDDNFGLPEIEYKPLDRDEDYQTPVGTDSQDEVTTGSYEYDTEETSDERQDDHIFNPVEEKSSSAGKILAILAVLVCVGLAAYYFGYYKPAQDRIARETREKQDDKARKDQAKADALRQAELQRQADEQRRADSLAAASAAPKIGTIETLSGRTGRYYVVVASDIDDDLLMDYANKLSRKGVSTQIIPAHGSVKFSRITVASGDTYGEAQSTADELKSEYEAGTWVIKY